jgi:hypothetical protein
LLLNYLLLLDNYDDDDDDDDRIITMDYYAHYGQKNNTFSDMMERVLNYA